MLLDLIILVLLIFSSALYSGSEIAFIVSNKLKLELKAKQNNYLVEKALHFLNNPKEFFIIVLVGNNIFNIAFSSVFAIFLYKLFEVEALYAMLLTSFVLLIFGELIPKVFFRENAEKFVSFFSLFLLLSKIFLSPIIFIINYIIDKTLNVFKISMEPENLSYTRDDLYQLIKTKDKELSHIERLFELLSLDVKDIMVPRTEIVAVSKNIPVQELIKLFNKVDLSKILIYRENIDDIIGCVFVNDLINELEDLEKIGRPVIYIPETMNCSALLRQFQNEKKEIAVVVDEFGGTAGIVTLSDLLDEIIGQFDEKAITKRLFHKKISDEKFIFSGRIELNFINEKYNINLPSSEALTLNGFITEVTGKVPEIGEIVKVDKFQFKILKARKTYIELLELEILE